MCRTAARDSRLRPVFDSAHIGHWRARSFDGIPKTQVGSPWKPEATLKVWLWIGAALLVACTSPDQGAERPTKPRPGGGTPDAGPQACGDVVCDPNATCGGVGDAVKCSCLSGFEGDGKTCTDIDECKDPAQSGCAANADCVNRPGGYLCKCKDGFLGDGKTCAAVNECQGAANTCDPNAVCAETSPTFSCTCKAGFTGDGHGCGDVNECKTPGAFSCAANAHCENTFGGYGCACNPGFSGDGNTACAALCDAARTNPSVCGSHGVCRVDGLQAICDACAGGFIGDGKTCTATTTCGAACDGAGADDDAHAVCASDGTCACAPGYGGTVGTCSDVDECATSNGGCGQNEACTNTQGGHACTCNTGFERDSSGKCVDTDECKAVPGPCHPDATCTNKTMDANGQGFSCACKSGFTGDGSVCTDVDECAKNNGGCAANATCENQRGSFACTCQAPLVGDPANCHCDLSGLWAMRQDLDTCWKGRAILGSSGPDVVEAGSVEATVWELHELTYDGTDVSVRRKGCGSDNTPDLISLPFNGETYSLYTPLDVFNGIPLQGNDKFAAKGVIPGSTITTPSTVGLIGIDLGSDPLNAPWPATYTAVTASQWTDPDQDGEPGFTFWPRTPSEITDAGTTHYSYLPIEAHSTAGGAVFIYQRAGCVSVAARVVTHLEATVESCTRITGNVINEKAEGRVHGCTLVDRGVCPDNQSTNDCPGWSKDITCTKADWAAATRCTDTEIGRLDDDENQTQDSRATFELVKMGKLGDTLDCPDVRTLLPSIPHTTPTITCKTPP